MSVKFKNNEIANEISRDVYWFNFLQNIYSSTFRWKYLPKTIDAYYMERTWTDNGCVFAYEVPNVGLVCLAANIGNRLNVYGYPTAYNVWGENGYTDYVSIDQGVPGYDNILRCSPIYDLKLYANRLAAIDISIDVNTRNQRTPYIFACNKDQELSVKNLNQQIQEGKQAIFVNKKGMEDVNLNVIQTPAPYVADKLQTLKKEILAEVLNYTGIFSGSPYKAERVTSGENAGNVGYIRAARNTRLNQRLLFAEKFNEKFKEKLDRPIEVEYSEETMEMLAAGALKIGDEELEQIHNYLKGNYGEPDQQNGTSGG